MGYTNDFGVIEIDNEPNAQTQLRSCVVNGSTFTYTKYDQEINYYFQQTAAFLDRYSKKFKNNSNVDLNKKTVMGAVLIPWLGDGKCTAWDSTLCVKTWMDQVKGSIVAFDYLGLHAYIDNRDFPTDTMTNFFNNFRNQVNTLYSYGSGKKIVLSEFGYTKEQFTDAPKLIKKMKQDGIFNNNKILSGLYWHLLARKDEASWGGYWAASANTAIYVPFLNWIIDNSVYNLDNGVFITKTVRYAGSAGTPGFYAWGMGFGNNVYAAVQWTNPQGKQESGLIWYTLNSTDPAYRISSGVDTSTDATTQGKQLVFIPLSIQTQNLFLSGWKATFTLYNSDTGKKSNPVDMTMTPAGGINYSYY